MTDEATDITPSNDVDTASSVIARLRTTFHDSFVIEMALTHRSYLNEHKGKKIDHNERLEFLGDAVLELVVTDALYRTYPNPEGELTSWRAALVNGEMLAKIARALGMETELRMSRGEARDTGRGRDYILANALEAVIGALYIDQGYGAAKEFINQHILSRLPDVLANKSYKDAKSYFQEMAQQHYSVTPHYALLGESGPDHDRQFIVGAYIGEELIARGEGYSKQEAQRVAAKRAIEKKGW